MPDEEETVRMTVREIALMRRIIAWRMTNEIEFVRRRMLGTYWVDTFGLTGAKGRAVAIDLTQMDALGTCAGRYASYCWHEVESVTQGVDVLVAYGYLPARFASAYFNGTADTAAAVRSALAPFTDGGKSYDATALAVADALSARTTEALT